MVKNEQYVPYDTFQGAYADFQSKKQGIWMNDPTWTYWKCALYAWFPLLTSGILVDRSFFLLLTFKLNEIY